MKKGLIFIITLALAGSMSAQIYVGLGAGYGMGANKQFLGTEASATKTTALNGSYGQGININVELGFFFNDNLGVELGINDFMGSTITESKNETSSTETKANLIRIAPQLVYKFDNGLYGRFGMMIPVTGKMVTKDENTDYMGGGETLSAEYETKGALAIGFTSALGMNFKLSDKMNFFVELQYNGLAIKPASTTVTKYEYNGTDQLPSMPTSQKEIEYFDELDTSTISTADDPGRRLATPAAFSSIGLNLGVQIKF